MSTTSSLGAPTGVPTALPRFDFARPLHDGAARPFAARALGSHEFKALDVLSFVSPKEKRAVHVVGPYAFGSRLQLEFDPSVTAVTERPRRLKVAGRDIELSFWWREQSGREHFALLVPDADTLPCTDGRRRPRQLERLRGAAADAAIDLRLVLEHEVKDKAARIELYFHLLGFVQSADQLKSGLAIRRDVMHAVSLRDRCRVDQVTSDLSRIPPSHVHIVIAELIFLGALATDATPRLMTSSLLWRLAQ